MQFQKTNRLAYVNFLRTRYEAWTGETLVRSYPYFLGLDPTSVCQLRCPHCPTGVENEDRRQGGNVRFRNRALLDVALFDSLLDELGDYLFLIMFYNWGEPLLNKNLPEMIRKAKTKEIYTEVHSNLSLRLSDHFIEALIDSGADELAGSIDGFSQESYEIYRRGGNFELAKSNLEKLLRARDRMGRKTRIIWNFLVFSFNEHEIPAAREYCDALGITFNTRDALTENPEWRPSHRKSEVTTLGPSVKPPSYAGTAPPSPCYWHYGYSYVNADGSVSPCCAPWDQKHDFGVIKPGAINFVDVWNNSRYRKSRAAFMKKEIKGLDAVDTLCLRCPYGDSMQQMYAPLDAEVRNQFQRSIGETDPLLARGFDLLADKARFVEFFAEHFITDFSDTLPAPRENRPDACDAEGAAGRRRPGSSATAAAGKAASDLPETRTPPGPPACAEPKPPVPRQVPEQAAERDRATIELLLHQVQALRAAAQADRAALADKEHLLNVTRGSLGWKVLATYGRLKNRLMPLGSRRRRLYGTTSRAVLTLSRGGLGGLIRKAAKAWFKEEVGPAAEAAFCNVCGWRGEQFLGHRHSESLACPACGSISRDRLLYEAFLRHMREQGVADKYFMLDGTRLPCAVVETSPRLSNPALNNRYVERMKEVCDEYIDTDFNMENLKAARFEDMQNLTFPANSVDFFLSSHVIEHVPDDRRAFAEVFRVLKPGGAAFFQMPVQTFQTFVPETAEYHEDSALVMRRNGWDVADKMREAGFEVSILVCDELFLCFESPPARDFLVFDDVTYYGKYGSQKEAVGRYPFLNFLSREQQRTLAIFPFGAHEVFRCQKGAADARHDGR